MVAAKGPVIIYGGGRIQPLKSKKLFTQPQISIKK
jgi:hypothetical protein